MLLLPLASSPKSSPAILTVILILLGRHMGACEHRMQTLQSPVQAYRPGPVHASMHCLAWWDVAYTSMRAHTADALSHTIFAPAVNQGGPARYGTGNQGNAPAENGAAPAASGVYGVNPATRGPYGAPAGGAGYGAPLQNQGTAPGAAPSLPLSFELQLDE